MSIRSDFLERRFEAYLERRTLPRGFEGKPKLIEVEMDALHRCVDRYAPAERYEPWFAIFEDRLSEDARTRAWPTEGEIKAAANAISMSNAPAGPRTGYSADPLEIAAKRMNAGEHVAESYVWGERSNLLQSRGMVSPESMEAYRMGSIQHAKTCYRHEAEAVLTKRWGEVVSHYFSRLKVWENVA